MTARISAHNAAVWAEAVGRLTGRYVHPAEDAEKTLVEALAATADRLENLEAVTARLRDEGKPNDRKWPRGIGRKV